MTIGINNVQAADLLARLEALRSVITDAVGADQLAEWEYAANSILSDKAPPVLSADLVRPHAPIEGMPRHLLTTREAASVLGIHPQYLRVLVSRGDGPATAMRAGPGPGHARHFDPEELARWSAERARKKGAVEETTAPGE